MNAVNQLATTLALCTLACGGRTQLGSTIELGAPDAAAVCDHRIQILAEGPAADQQLAVDDFNVYWNDDRYALSTPNAGGETLTLADTKQHCPIYLSVDQKWLYYSDTVSAKLRRVPKGGGPSDVVGAGAGWIVNDENAVYWAAHPRIWKALKSGGAPQILVDNHVRPFALVHDETALYWAETPFDSAMRIFSMSKMGGAPTQLAEVVSITALAVHPTGLYFITQTSFAWVRAAVRRLWW